MAFQALKHKHHEFIHIVNTSNAHSVHGDRQDEPTGMSSDDPAGEVQSMEQKRQPEPSCPGLPFFTWWSAGIEPRSDRGRLRALRAQSPF